MPLLDHFHPPLSASRHWEGFHAQWAASIASALNHSLLPEGYFAEAQVHVGGRVAPAAGLVMPAIFPDSLEVLIYSSEAGPTPVAAVELVSPGNKDRPEYRRAFAVKCASCLQHGLGLIVIDIVTSCHANLHDELVRVLELGDSYLVPANPLYALAYRPVRRSTVEQIDVWVANLSVGQPLPQLPLALDKSLCVPLDLDPTYVEACQRSRLP